ncbi:MAG: hypothetical protein WCO60_20230 [Verrucomicrobiota bacterium]
MPQEPTIRELGDRWLEASGLGDITTKTLGIDLRKFVELNDLWNISEGCLTARVYELTADLLRSKGVAAFFSVFSGDAPHRPVDLAAVPIPQWRNCEYMQVIIPPIVFDKIRDRSLTTEEANEIEEELEAYYGVSDPFWISYRGKGSSHVFDFMVDG